MFNITREDHGEIVVLNISGEFFVENIEFAEKTWNQVIAQKPRVIGINCHDIKFVDSSAIGVLVKFLNYSTKQKIELVFYDLSDSLINIFDTAKLGNFFTILTKEQFNAEYLS